MDLTKRAFIGALSAMFNIVFLSACTTTGATEQQDRKPVEVMILGTFHFTGGGNDLVNPELDDFLAPGRQAEIMTLVDKIEAFAPDKVMVELELKYEEAFNQKFQDYLEGKHELSVNERQQVGMRLAAQLGHERLYAIDYDNFLDYRGAVAAAEKGGQNHLLTAMDEEVNAIKILVESQKKLDITERLIQLNTVSEFDHNFFMRIAQMGSVENPQGALQILTWWERNLVMFARTALHAEPSDKILIIVGAGHNYILHEFFSSAEGFSLTSPIPYLQ